MKYLTDDAGVPTPTLNALREFDPDWEPRRGSVLLSSGQFGTAWQRHFSDGLWHSTRGWAGDQPKTWTQLSRFRNLVLVYDAPDRDALDRQREAAAERIAVNIDPPDMTPGKVYRMGDYKR